MTARFDGKQATARIAVFEWKGGDIERVRERAVQEAESRFGELKSGSGWADPSPVLSASELEFVG